MRERFNDMITNRDSDYRHPAPQESYSRELDSRVQSSEMPYGYSYGEPPADSGNHNERAHETKMQHRPRK